MSKEEGVIDFCKRAGVVVLIMNQLSTQMLVGLVECCCCCCCWLHVRRMLSLQFMGGHNHTSGLPTPLLFLMLCASDTSSLISSVSSSDCESACRRKHACQEQKAHPSVTKRLFVDANIKHS
jgi:hypothetical protein